ncbi:MAG: DUF255 domain-containing protein [Gemmatimonadota bacterium]
MPQQFRFSPRPNRAHEIQWQPWSKEAFANATAADRPILLCLTAVWCHWCHQMDENTYSDSALIELINQHFVPIRVDADQYPHVQDRYIAGGWPTNAFLTPTGEVLWSGTYIEAEQFAAVADGVRNAWTERRAELGVEIERRRKALEAARGRGSVAGMVRREAADDVWASLLESFDARNGGFGDAPKYPTPEALELLFVRSDEGDAARIAMQTLDGMLAGELWDANHGGFFRYALTQEWTQPQTEKLLSINAGLLRAYVLGAHLHNRADWRAIAERLVTTVEQTLPLQSGLWASSQAAAPEFYAALPEKRGGLDAPGVDGVLYTSVNAQWIRALADAGARLQRSDWIERAESALAQLLSEMAAPNDLMYHFREPGGDPQLPYLLLDTLEAARACISVSQATGKSENLLRARAFVSAIEKSFWADESGFYDRTRTTHDVGVLRYRDRPFDVNADMARLLIDLSLALGERSYRALAERTLAFLSPSAGRYGVGGAPFATAVHEFFDPPLQVFVVGTGPDADALRKTALALPIAHRRVWPLPKGGRIGTQTFAVRDTAVAYATGPHGASPPISDPAGLADAMTHVA